MISKSRLVTELLLVWRALLWGRRHLTAGRGFPLLKTEQQEQHVKRSHNYKNIFENMRGKNAKNAAHIPKGEQQLYT